MVDRWIFEEYKPLVAGLPLYRVLFASYILLVVLPRYGWIGAFPDIFFHPPVGIPLLFEGFPPTWFFHLLNFGLMVAGVSLLVGWWPRVASLAIAGLLIVGNSWAYSFGKINHDILPIVVALVMAFSGWGGRIVQQRPISSEPAWPMALLALLIGLAMLTAAWPKLTSGWLDPHAPATLGHLMRNHYVTGRETWLSTMLVQFGWTPFWKLLDYGTLLIEGGMLLAIVSRHAFRVFCALACLFHFGVWMVMDIGFSTNVTAYAAFANWALLLHYEPIRRGCVWIDWVGDRANLFYVIAAAGGLFGVYLTIGNPWGGWLSRLILVAGALVGGYYVLSWVWRVLRSIEKSPAVLQHD